MSIGAGLLSSDARRLLRLKLSKGPKLMNDQIEIIPPQVPRGRPVDLVDELRALSELLPHSDRRDKDVLACLLREKRAEAPATANDLLRNTAPAFAVRMLIRACRSPPANSARDLLPLESDTAAAMASLRAGLRQAAHFRGDLSDCDAMVRIEYPNRGTEEDDEAEEAERPETGVLSRRRREGINEAAVDEEDGQCRDACKLDRAWDKA